METATDNRNRTVAEIRHLMSKGGGSMGENGCVSWKFERKGVIQFSKEKYTEDQLMEAALEAGADDLRDEGDVWEIQTAMADFNAVREAFEAAGLEMNFRRAQSGSPDHDGSRSRNRPQASALHRAA